MLVAGYGCRYGGAALSVTRATVIIHDEAVRAKLVKAVPNILAHNRLLVGAMLEVAKPMVETATPLGPGHFGYHGRDTIRILIISRGRKTLGQLRAAIQLYWRERGTKTGEHAFMTAHKALGSTRRFISFYYGGMARWWHL